MSSLSWGPNGAGKSTTIKMLAGYLQPSQGEVLFQNQLIAKDLRSAKMKIGYMPESTPSYGEMTVTEYLIFIAEAYGLKDKKSAVEKVISLTRLERVRHQLIETLSKGYRSRVSFAAAIIHDPPVLLLDEPTDGLDPNQKNEIRTLIKNLAHDKAVVVSTHILEEVSAMCNRVIVISEGRKVLDGTTRDLENSADQRERIVISIPREQREKFEAALATTLRMFESGPNGHDKFLVDTDFRPQELVKKISENGLAFQELFLEKPNIDQAFRKITRTTE
jgi:ABC-2 type transport system ATP-binding protein